MASTRIELSIQGMRRLPMHEDERASSPCGHEVGADDRFPDARWRHEEARIV